MLLPPQRISPFFTFSDSSGKVDPPYSSASDHGAEPTEADVAAAKAADVPSIVKLAAADEALPTSCQTYGMDAAMEALPASHQTNSSVDASS